MPVLSNFPGGSSSGGGFALDAVSGIATQVASGKVYIKWTDPEDMIADEIALATWSGTLLVRKAGSMPSGRRDGTVILDSKLHNAYKDAYFCDSGLTDGETYYYKFFPYTTTKTYTDSGENEFSATPSAHVTGIDDWVVTNMSASTEAGNGKMEIMWTDPAATIVSDDVTLATWGGTTVVVKEGGYPTSKDDADAVYTLKTITYNQFSTSALTVDGLTNGVTYYVGFFPETTDGYVNTSDSQRTTGAANLFTIDAEPVQSGTLTYTGNPLTPAWNNFNPEQLVIEGTTTGTNAGEYMAVFTPTEDYQWSDGTVSSRNVTWAIKKAVGSVEINPTSITLDSNAPTASFTVVRTGDGIITAQSNNADIVTVTPTSSSGVGAVTFTISSVNEKTGEASISISVAEGTNYNAVSGSTVSVTAKFMPAIGTPLNDCTWEEISKIAASGQAANYFKVGDTKAVNVNGKVGIMNISQTYYVFILGFNHNGAANTIDFGTFKTALSGGVDTCLTDSYYGGPGANGTACFSMNHTQYGTAAGGWKSCNLRYDVLGSTDVYNGDASATTATNPISNTLMAALPSDLRAVMKPMTVYSDNVGNGTNTSSNVTATVDYLPLLSAIEVQGSGSVNNAEKNYQKRYDYYTSGNSYSKYASAGGEEYMWWTRSVYLHPYYPDIYGFDVINPYGKSDNGMAYWSYGVAPVFRV